MPEFSARGVLRDTIGLLRVRLPLHLAYALLAALLSTGSTQIIYQQLLTKVAAGSLAAGRIALSPLYWLNALMAALIIGWSLIGIVGSMLRSEDASFSVSDLAATSATNIGNYLVLYLAWYLALIVGMMLFVVPGLIVLTAFAASIPAMIDRRLGPWAALRESRSLTKGKRFRVFGTLLVVVVITVLPAIAILPKFGGGSGAVLKSVVSRPASTVAIALITGSLSTVLYSAYFVALYRRLGGGGGITSELRDAFA